MNSTCMHVYTHATHTHSHTNTHSHTHTHTHTLTYTHTYTHMHTQVPPSSSSRPTCLWSSPLVSRLTYGTPRRCVCATRVHVVCVCVCALLTCMVLCIVCVRVCVREHVCIVLCVCVCLRRLYVCVLNARVTSIYIMKGCSVRFFGSKGSIKLVKVLEP